MELNALTIHVCDCWLTLTHIPSHGAGASQNSRRRLVPELSQDAHNQFLSWIKKDFFLHSLCARHFHSHTTNIDVRGRYRVLCSLLLLPILPPLLTLSPLILLLYHPGTLLLQQSLRQLCSLYSFTKILNCTCMLLALLYY